MKGRKIISFVMALTMTLPVGMYVNNTTVSARMIDSNYQRQVLWSTSFENSEGFVTDTLDVKGAESVNGSLKTDIVGDLSYLVDKANLSGSDMRL